MLKKNILVAIILVIILVIFNYLLYKQHFYYYTENINSYDITRHLNKRIAPSNKLIYKINFDRDDTITNIYLKTDWWTKKPNDVILTFNGETKHIVLKDYIDSPLSQDVCDIGNNYTQSEYETLPNTDYITKNCKNAYYEAETNKKIPNSYIPLLTDGTEYDLTKSKILDITLTNHSDVHALFFGLLFDYIPNQKQTTYVQQPQQTQKITQCIKAPKSNNHIATSNNHHPKKLTNIIPTGGIFANNNNNSTNLTQQVFSI